ncbi:subtilisin-like protease SBT1.4 [Papaver somniferum]|uniref:subtilisin-like protease SBT1.4 n=1 Tax=Papaver somniferum TaxID=3469 RepID=UPI000E6FC35C|nr:subtilisin-like protease SBT1.4 [Papaver somniferum]
MPTSRASANFLLIIIFLVSPLLSLATSYNQEDNEQLKTFIVFVSKPDKPSVFLSHLTWYDATLASLRTPASSSNNQHHKPRQIIYAYDHAMHGFAARLTLSQASHLRNVPGIVSVLPEQSHQLHTTRTPQFLGLDDKVGIWPESGYGDDVIVGVFDSGIWPERRSFHDEGLGPVPERWKGICEVGPDFPKESCNKKIIGARTFSKGYEAFLLQSKMNVSAAKSISARDMKGHGTHCASIAAGSAVPGASLGPYAAGVAQGMAPRARIAVYKVCWPDVVCLESDILAAFESAIADGVDVISMSLGLEPLPYNQQLAMIGAFHAMQKGITVSCSAGNHGPAPKTVTNLAPWVLTVGASTIDREFPANVILGDKTVLPGVSLFYGKSNLSESNVLVYGGDCGSETCEEGKLDVNKVKGNIVVCETGGVRAAAAYAVKLAGGIGVILVESKNRGESLSAIPHLIPGTTISYKSGRKIRNYIRTTNESRKYYPVAMIEFKGTSIGFSPSSPKIVAVSSRGPNPITPEILKPDIIAPGFNILAAWTGSNALTKVKEDRRMVEFSMQSGTSMACPHVSGIAALLKSVHPTWSPGAIKSAIMTTAYNVDNSRKNITRLADGKYATLFELGSGHVDPNKALHPGLVYDVETKDYAQFLCSINYSSRIISEIFVHKKVDCRQSPMASPGDLNYPSFSVVFKSGINTVKYERTVKNVGPKADAVYKVKINSPPSVNITVSPGKLVFSKKDQFLSYKISFSSRSNDMKVTGSGEDKQWSFGSIEWTDGEHNVRSPIAFIWDSTTNTSLIS